MPGKGIITGTSLTLLTSLTSVTTSASSTAGHVSLSVGDDKDGGGKGKDILVILEPLE